MIPTWFGGACRAWPARVGRGFGRAREDRDSFSLDGFLNLSGTPLGALPGPQAFIAELVTYYRMGDPPRVLGRGWYTGFSLEAGDSWSREPGRFAACQD